MLTQIKQAIGGWPYAAANLPRLQKQVDLCERNRKAQGK